ncbi:contact-dependent growth inhibition system immunity protein [Photorhabdus luminescens]|uniref:contact-dependent growth inhibition system immunity protein n=1 Tax=Photorhabdus luminescens TaxID=29488 RepID=UPI00223F58BC|nr:contact-dependent growth inhibition system immunity protein [Photorhabdus luminescens]MCW7763723.1 contact-dependent growth inhibition system immunity protein [Photorhabdus luminescens subsp. venezuelensis]
MSADFKQGLNARCVFNGDFYSITSYSGYRSLNLDPLGGNHMLSPDTSDEKLGVAVFDALSKSRFIPFENLGDFLDNEKRKERYDQWVTEMMGFHRYRSRRQLFKKMNSCDIRLLDGVITIMPYGHEKLELWTGKGVVESDNVVIPADSSPAEVGAALRLAFSRCRSYV